MEADLLTVFADPSTFKDLDATQRIWAALITTVLGMGITFVVLVILQFVLGLFDKLAGPEHKPKAAATPASAAKKAEEAPAPQTDDELVPVIAASIAVMLQTSASNIVIRDIQRLEDRTSPWSRAGIVEQMQTRA